MNYRRNGKLQACEPCRKGKLKCDHMMPHCGRCVRKGRVDKCVYHPAPLTKTGVPTPCIEDGRRPSRTPSGAGNDPASAAYLDHLEQSSRSTSFTDIVSSVQSSVQTAKSPTASTPASFLASPSYWPERGSVNVRSQDAPARPQQPPSNQVLLPGLARFPEADSFISHSAVLAENEPSIGLSPPALSESVVSSTYIDKGAAVLLLLRDLDSIQKYIDKWFSFAGGVVVIEPMVKIYLDGLSSTWGRTLESAKATDLQDMSTQVWHNTSKPASLLLKRGTTPREFCANVTGANLRWEVVGIIASLVSLVAQTLKGILSNMSNLQSLAELRMLTICCRWRSCILLTRRCAC